MIRTVGVPDGGGVGGVWGGGGGVGKKSVTQLDRKRGLPNYEGM